MTNVESVGQIRRCEVIGNGAFKIVYKAYDEDEGIDVAWNEILLDRFKNVNDYENTIMKEIKILTKLSHPSILKISKAWFDKKRNTLIFISEFLSNGTIKSYVSEMVKKPQKTAIARWCYQILQGLNYLHTHDPPVIHRDIKCDNIFIDASEGIVKIGDFGLSKMLDQVQEADSCLGTPAYTAPEVYTGKYNTRVDIWSFGLCVLEMATAETPYQECRNIGQIYYKVSNRELPLLLSRVSDPLIADMIQLCLLPKEYRPSAEELLEHPLFDELKAADSMKDNHQTVKDNMIKRHKEQMSELQEELRAQRREFRKKLRSSNQ